MTNIDRKIIKLMFATICELLFSALVGPYYSPYFMHISDLRRRFKENMEIIKDWGE